MVGSHQQPLTRRQAREHERAGTATIDSPFESDERAPDDGAVTLNSSLRALSEAVSSDETASQSRRDTSSGRPLTRRELRMARQKNEATRETTHPIVGDESLGTAEPLVDEVSGRTIEVEAKPAEVVQPSPDEWAPLADSDDLSNSDQMYDEVLTGSVTVPPATTDALILPTLPHDDAQIPVADKNGTGQILITGSIDLPPGLGATGQHPDFFDDTDVDQALERDDRFAPRSGATPVRATSAVSTQASARGIVVAPHSPESRVPLVLMIVAATLAVAVGAVLIVGIIAGAF